MHKLTIIDLENFIMEGEFERFKSPPKATLDINSIIRAANDYNTNHVKKGFAFGHLNDGFLLIPTDKGEKVDETQNAPAFMVVDVEWNSAKKGIVGKIMILDTPDGLKIKESVQKGMHCYISGSETTAGVTVDKDSGRRIYRVMDLQGYKLSILDY